MHPRNPVRRVQAFALGLTLALGANVQAFDPGIHERLTEAELRTLGFDANSADEVGDCQDLDMWLDLNGQRMQTGNTKTMIYGVAELIAYMSRFVTLEPGDILTTGTPPGVGEGQKPDKIFLKPGDVMRLGVEKLGEQQQTVVAWTKEGLA